MFNSLNILLFNIRGLTTLANTAKVLYYEIRYLWSQ